MKKYDFDSLRRVQIFSSLSDDELLSIADRMTIKHFSKKEVILDESVTNDFMYAILTGSVKAVQHTVDGREIVLAIHKSGDFFGEMSIIDQQTSPATVVALEYCSVAIVSREQFYFLLYSERKVLDNILKMFCFRLRDSWGKLRMANMKQASDRIAALFNSLSGEFGEDTHDGVLLNIRLTHQNIAGLTSLTREAVTRALDNMQRSGIINIEDDKRIRFRGAVVPTSEKTTELM